MEVIRDKAGKVIGQSQSLAGIRRYVAKHLISQMDVSRIIDDSGKLSILFHDGSNFKTNFASFAVLCGWVLRWRSAYGCPIRINGNMATTLNSRHAVLVAHAK